MSDETCGCGKHAKAILHAAPKVDGRGFLKVAGGAGDLADAEAKHDGLGDHLIIEDEVIGVFEQRESLEYIARKGAEAGVVFRELDSEEEVLEGRKKTVGDVFVARHATFESSAADDAGAKYDVVDSAGDHIGHGGDEGGIVLVVRMDHDDDVGASGEGFTVAGLLIASVAVVRVVDEGLN